jgi:spectinomycin phosphotransferase
VREPPPQVDVDLLTTTLAAHWDDAVVRVEHLPVGFGAHHWAAYDVRDEPRLFVTFDRLAPRRTAEVLEAAYAGAAALRDQGLDFVVAPVLTHLGTHTVTFADGALSCAPWLHGEPSGEPDLAWTTEALGRLHAATPPPLPRWRPLVGPDLAESLAALTERAWGPGPYADAAREAVRDRLGDLAAWTTRYHILAGLARRRQWVATHGEPHSDNQLLTAHGRMLVDWESARLAPAELDLRTLVDGGASPAEVGADLEMLELFGLEWRLDEVSQYAAWFAAPHNGGEDDRIAFAGLLHELHRAARP